MLIDQDVISFDHPVLIRLPKGDMKVTRLKKGEIIRIGRIKIPGMQSLIDSISYEL